ncbi:DUF5788 family protein [Halobacteriaceae archaeon GCM10025711]
MREFERKQLLERVGREGATVGATIPETIDLQGDPFDLREFVFEVKRAEGVSADERQEVQDMKKLLRRARTDRRDAIEEDDLSKAEGERLVEEIIGIDRALNALESLGRTDLEAEVEARQTADQKRWMSFLRQALGRGNSGRRRR